MEEAVAPPVPAVGAPQDFITDYPRRYFNFRTQVVLHGKSKGRRLRQMLLQKREELKDRSLKLEAGRDVAHEIGFLFGSWMANKLSSRTVRRDTKKKVELPDGSVKYRRLRYDNWEDEFKDLGFILLHDVFDEDGLTAIRSELFDRSRKKARQGDEFKWETMFNGAVSRKYLFEQKASGRWGIKLDGCPVTSGFIDGLKEVMGWLERRYCDVAYIKPFKNQAAIAAGKKDPELHVDMDTDELETTRWGCPEYPIVIFLNLDNGKMLKIWHQKLGGTRGRHGSPYLMEVPPGAVLIWDPTKFKHATAAIMADPTYTDPPHRVNILLHGVGGL